MRVSSFSALLVAGMALLLPVFSAAAQETSVPSVSDIQAKIESVKASSAYDDALREELNTAYNSALDQLRAAEEWKATAAKYEQALKEAPDEVVRLREELDQPPEELEPDFPTGASVAVMEGLLARTESELAGLRTDRAALEKRLFERTERRRQLPELLAGARRRLEDVAAGPATAEEADPLAEAQRILALAKRAALQNEIAAYEKELESYEMRGQLLTLQLYEKVREVAAQERLVEAWRDLLRERRQEEAVEAVRKASEVLSDAEAASPRVREIAQRLAEEDIDLVKQRTDPGGLVDKIEVAEKKLRDMIERQAALEADFKRLSQKVEAVGLNNSIGMLLRRYREDLPDVSVHRRNLRARQNEIADVQMKQMELQEKRLELADIDSLLRAFLLSEQQTATPEQIEQVKKVLRNLLQIQRDTLDALLRDYDTYFEHLVDLDNAEQSLVNTTEAFTEYIDERVLWIRSGVMFSLSHLSLTWESLQQILAPGQWRQVPAAFVQEFVFKPYLGVLLLIAVGLAVWLYRRVAAELSAASGKARSSATTSFKLTVDAVAATILLSLPALAILWWIGHRLSGSAAAEPFARAVGAGLKSVAVVLWPLEFVRQSMRRDGIFSAHFGWMPGQVVKVRRNLLWLMPVVALCLFVLALLDLQPEETGRESLGRVAAMGMLAAIAIFNHRLFHPKRGALRRLYDHLFQITPRFRYAFYVLTVALPAVFALLVFGGYFYTIYRLTTRLYETAILFFVLLLVRGVILRWLLLTKRALAMELKRKKREALKAAAAEEPSTREEAVERHEEVDLDRVDVQTHRIIRSMIALTFLVLAWFIWAGELPALNILNDVEVWPAMEVTLGNILTGIVIVVLTIIATANLPGLLELTVLQRMHYLKGERYAITTIVRYAIAIIGFSAAFHNFGIGWTRVQWLIAALGVGLGFGLQEIFANFISGIIILFERPIRVGDVVTVGGISGTVARIRTRATWIVDWDRKELVVPNKEFITSQVVNWTLTDSVIRLTVKVGIAYGSDTAKAERLLREVAKENPDVLEDPAPLILFMGFGESSLDFELRVYCGSVDYILSLIHELHMAIDKKFREAGIEIAFPQRDIHIRSFDAALPLIKPEEKPSQ